MSGTRLWNEIPTLKLSMSLSGPCAFPLVFRFDGGRILEGSAWGLRYNTAAREKFRYPLPNRAYDECLSISPFPCRKRDTIVWL